VSAHGLVGRAERKWERWIARCRCGGFKSAAATRLRAEELVREHADAKASIDAGRGGR
jgi:hypothetical protein